LNNQYLTIWDLVLTPVYLGILVVIAKAYRDKNYPVGHPLREYYLGGLYAKFFGAIFIALIYQFYYGGAGDSFSYFSDAKVINSSLSDSFDNWVSLLLGSSYNSQPAIYPFISQMIHTDTASHTVTAIAAVFGLFNGTSYIPIALLFAFFSYSGIWAMYKTFARIYPRLTKELAIAFLFVPSVCVWGSAIFKDTICMFGLGWMTYTTFRIFVDRDFSIKNFLLLAISFTLIALTKVYIILAFVPALVFWLMATYSSRIKIIPVRFMLYLTVVAVVGYGFVFFSEKFSEELNQYSLDRILKTAESTRSYIFYVSERDEGSSYDLGQFDPSITSILLKFPAGVNVTLFRPYLWETKKPIMVLSAAEGLIFTILTLLMFFKFGIRKLLKKIFSDPNILFLLIFSLIFAFAVGISSYNFGTLSRYKIPCMPFYAAFLMIILYSGGEKAKIGLKKVARPMQYSQTN
jgi:hypothetical protein